MFDINNISLKNDKTWKLIVSGNTSGVFQLESELGKQWARNIKPRNINELSALLALIRPACLESGMTAQYARVKNSGEEPVSFDDEDIDRILKPTNGVLIYQEQLMKFGGEIAWKHFDYIDRLVIVDKLRKGIGKKNAKIISDLKEKFISGCIHNGKNKSLAEKLFDMIEKAGRYAFNDAHAKKYALWSYRTAYAKANFPLEFYSVYLSYSRLKQKPKEEIRSLVSEARMLNLLIRNPCLSRISHEFSIEGKGINYGLSHIKQVSSNDIDILLQNEDYTKSFGGLIRLHIDKTGLEKRVRSSCIESLIKCGACDIFGVSRVCMLETFTVIKSLTPKEQKFVCEKILEKTHVSISDLKDMIVECANTVSVKSRKEMIISEATSIDISSADSQDKNFMLEKDLIGIEFSKIKNLDVGANLTCKQCYLNYKNNKDKKGNISVKVSEIIRLKTKTGKNPGREMCQLLCVDNTGNYKFACFPEQYEKYKDILCDNMNYILNVKGTGSGWCVNSVNLM